MTTLEEGDVVLCTVDRIVGTVVFVTIEGNGEGSIITSEIAPGRIRNLREYVVPKKKIVCKILRISNGNINLSLRRVTQKERKDVLEQYKLEKSYQSILKSILGEKSEETIKKIEEKENLAEFLQKAKVNSKELEKIVGKENLGKILEIINIQKTKKSVVKKEFIFSSKKPNGITIIKKFLGNSKDFGINYISAGKYAAHIESENPKSAENKIREFLEELEEKSKKENINFEVIEK